LEFEDMGDTRVSVRNAVSARTLRQSVVGIDHIGSAHDEAQLALLMEIARQRLHEGQGVLDFADTEPGAEASQSGARVSGMRSQRLWDVLAGACARLG
jgi:hypothetical protein